MPYALPGDGMIVHDGHPDHLQLPGLRPLSFSSAGPCTGRLLIKLIASLTVTGLRILQ